MACVAQQLDTDRLIAAASSLSERINGGWMKTSDERVNAKQSNQLFQTWLASAAQGDWNKFDQRLAWDGLDRDTAGDLVTTSSQVALHASPFWADTVRLLLEWLEIETRTFELTDETESIPFAHALLGLSAFGMRQLMDRAGKYFISATLQRSLERQLLARLSEVCDLTLGEEFLHFRQIEGSSTDNATSTTQYLEFTRKVRNGFPEIFTRYPVLARLVATAILFWVNDMAEFLERLRDDLPSLTTQFFDGLETGQVIDIDGLRSDPHASGRTVKILTFAGGQKLVYKPKSLAIDAAWKALLEWIHGREPQIDVWSPTICDRGAYGWVECIEHAPCESRDELERFYFRAGMLVCLLYAVRATDFHFENVIASRDHLVPIDLETLFCHDALVSSSGGAAAEKTLRSVLRSGLMPTWQVIGKSGAAFDFSGLGSNCQDQPAAKALGWQHVNTDQMRLGEVQTSIRQAENLPFFNGTPAIAGECVEEVVGGFNATYRALLRHRTEMLSDDSPLQAFRACDVRFVFRATQLYTRMIRRSLTPRLLRDGIERSLEFEVLARHLAGAAPAGCENMFRAELAALEQLDVPYFSAKAGSDVLSSHGRHPAQEMLQGPSWPAVVSQLQAMSEIDREHQEELIRASFHARTMRSPSNDSKGVTMPERPSTPTFDSNSFIERASRIADELVKRAIPDDDGGLHWIGVDYLGDADRYYLRPLGSSLYAGLGGIGLFFAALYSITGSTEHRQTALQVTRAIDGLMFPPNLDYETQKRSALAGGIGGADGLGSVIYSLVRIGPMIEDPLLIDCATRLARFLTEDVIAGDARLDVVGGSAGTILGLAALFSATRDRQVLETIRLCGHHLVQTQQASGGWLIAAELPLTGFSHGTAGIAYALMRGYEITREKSFLAAVRKATGYEQSLYSHTQKNWADLRDCRTVGEANFRMGWCHGAPGIGLARLGCLSVLDDPGFRADAERALLATNSQAAYPIDTMCCGEFGFTDLFLVAAERLRDPAWTEVARRRASAVIASAEAREKPGSAGYLLSGGLSNGTLSLGFFLGLAGIGYQLLRLAAPRQLPSVLLWE
jgi:type 2 lantibiotic biosynthesis protein LanM